MINKLDVYKPCYDCCKLPAGFNFFLRGTAVNYACEDKCGETGGGKNSTNIGGFNGPCPYTNFVTYNKEFDPCIFYTKIVRKDNYSNVTIFDNFTQKCKPLIDGGYIATTTTTYKYNEDGACERKIVRNAPLGFPGQSRSLSLEYSDPITDCQYIYEEPIETTGIACSEFINPFLVEKYGTSTTITEITHAPSQTCYFKYWVRLVFQIWDADQDPNAGPNDCGDPIWFQTGGNFVGQVYSYEWEGESTPCINNPRSPQSSEENLIVGTVNWLFDAPISGFSGLTSSVEQKYSFVKDYEPKWPSERSGGNDCKQDGYPLC